MSQRRLPRIVIVLAGVLPLVMALWGPVGAHAVGGPVADSSCTGRPQGVGPQIGCGGPATSLIFSTEPGGAQVNDLLNPQPVVEAVDDQQQRRYHLQPGRDAHHRHQPGRGHPERDHVGDGGGRRGHVHRPLHRPAGRRLHPGRQRPGTHPRCRARRAHPSATSDPFDITAAQQQGPAPASCDSIYAVTDGNTNSRFFKVGVNAPNTLTTLGGVHLGANFEGIEVDAESGSIYATTATSNKHGQKGMLFQVDGLTGALTPLFSTGFKDVEGLAFRPNGALWAWVDGKGLIEIDFTNQHARLVLPSKRHFEALAWEREGGLLYLAKDNKLWT